MLQACSRLRLVTAPLHAALSFARVAGGLPHVAAMPAPCFTGLYAMARQYRLLRHQPAALQLPYEGAQAAFNATVEQIARQFWPQVRLWGGGQLQTALGHEMCIACRWVGAVHARTAAANLPFLSLPRIIPPLPSLLCSVAACRPHFAGRTAVRPHHLECSPADHQQPCDCCQALGG